MAAVTVAKLQRRRLWRSVRRILRWSPVALLLAAPAAGFLLSRTPAAQGVLGRIEGGAVDASASLGLVVTDIEVEGRETTDPATIIGALGARRGTPILAVDPSRAKEQLEALPWVRSAVIERWLPGTLHVRLVERVPLAVWQHAGKQELIDREGAVIPVAYLTRFAKLPTVVGEGAPPHAASVIDMMASEPHLAARVTAAIWVGDRRWNLRIDNGIDVLLPETGASDAWARLARLEQDNHLLGRDLQIVDMRLPDRLVLRVNTPPAKEPPAAKKPHPPGKAT